MTSKARKPSVMVPVQHAPKGVRSVAGNCSENKSLDGDKVGENVGERGGGNSEESDAGPSETVKPVREGSVLDRQGPVLYLLPGEGSLDLDQEVGDLLS